RDEDPSHDREHRTRIAAALRQCPRPLRVQTFEGQVVCARPGPSGGHVVVLRTGGGVEVLETATGRAVGPAFEPGEEPRMGALSPEVEGLVLVGMDGAGRVIDPSAGNLRHLPGRPVPPGGRAALARGGGMLVTQPADAAFRLWDLTADEPV